SCVVASRSARASTRRPRFAAIALELLDRVVARAVRTRHAVAAVGVHSTGLAVERAADDDAPAARGTAVRTRASAVRRRGRPRVGLRADAAVRQDRSAAESLR